jgi:hypothetical protein
MTGSGIQLDPPIEKIEGSEIWRPVVGAESNYSVSSYGRLFSRIHHRLLRPTIGGRRVVLAGGRAVSVGELVLEAWGQPRPEPGAIAWAEDRNLQYPYQLSNLRWITRPELLAILREARAAERAGEARTLEHGELAVSHG